MIRIICDDDTPPGCAVKLKREDDVFSTAYLTNEATMSTQVAVEHMVGGILHQCHQVCCILTLYYLQNQIHMLGWCKEADD